MSVDNLSPEEIAMSEGRPALNDKCGTCGDTWGQHSGMTCPSPGKWTSLETPNSQALEALQMVCNHFWQPEPDDGPVWKESEVIDFVESAIKALSQQPIPPTNDRVWNKVTPGSPKQEHFVLAKHRGGLPFVAEREAHHWYAGDGDKMAPPDLWMELPDDESHEPSGYRWCDCKNGRCSHVDGGVPRNGGGCRRAYNETSTAYIDHDGEGFILRRDGDEDETTTAKCDECDETGWHDELCSKSNMKI